MRTQISQAPPSGEMLVATAAWRRARWITDNLTLRKAANLLTAGCDFVLKREVMRAWPVIAKVDISPLCNLRCTMCVHARPSAGSSAQLSAQRFSAGQKMPVSRYREVVAQLAGRTAAVSLYYVGDPLMHPHLDEICEATRAAGMNAHASTNFSFELTDERLRGLISSGMTHLTVCVDGLTQENYGRTRVGGRLALVVDNLRRLLAIRREMRRTYPRVEVQYIKFQHNLEELPAARTLCASLGVDQFTEMWGSLHNVTDFPDGHPRSSGPRAKRVTPRCIWPFFSLLILYDGDVIPCSNHRQGSQYTGGADRRRLGNVFESGVLEVWNSPGYRELRRIGSDPARARDPALASTFCEGCPTLFHTDVDRYFRRADAHAWEDSWEMGGRGRVLRKPLVQLGSTRAPAAGPRVEPG